MIGPERTPYESIEVDRRLGISPGSSSDDSIDASTVVIIVIGFILGVVCGNMP